MAKLKNYEHSIYQIDKSAKAIREENYERAEILLSEAYERINWSDLEQADLRAYIESVVGNLETEDKEKSIERVNEIKHIVSKHQSILLRQGELEDIYADKKSRE